MQAKCITYFQIVKSICKKSGQFEIVHSFKKGMAIQFKTVSDLHLKWFTCKNHIESFTVGGLDMKTDWIDSKMHSARSMTVSYGT